jgi:hypothetical protein
MAIVINAGSSSPDGWCLAWEGRYGYAYDEPAFRHLLALEQTRSAQLDLRILLLLVELKPPPLARLRVDPAGIAHRLFSVLSGCVRETDIVGWYRRHRVAGVVFTELADASGAEVSRLLQARIAGALDQRLPKTVTFHVHTRGHGYPRPTVIGTAAAVGAAETGA